MSEPEYLRSIADPIKPGHVVVHNPGGDVTVELGDTVVLIGPAAHVATVAYPWR